MSGTATLKIFMGLPVKDKGVDFSEEGGGGRDCCDAHRIETMMINRRKDQLFLYLNT